MTGTHRMEGGEGESYLKRKKKTPFGTLFVNDTVRNVICVLTCVFGAFATIYGSMILSPKVSRRTFSAQHPGPFFNQFFTPRYFVRFSIAPFYYT